MSATQEREQQLVRGTVTSLLVKGNDSWQIVVRPDNSQYDKKLWTKDQSLIGEMNQRGIGQRFDFICNASYWTNNQNQQVRSLWVEAVAQYGTAIDPAPPQQTPVSGGLPGMGGGLPGMGVPLPGPGTSPIQTQYVQPQQQQPGLQPGWAPAPGPPPIPGVSQTPPMGAPGTPGALPATQPEAYDPPIPHGVKELRILRQTAMKCACIMQGYIPEAQRGSLAGLQQMSEWFVAYFMGGPQDVPGSGFPQQPTIGEPTPPDWVQQDGPVGNDYHAGPEAQPQAAQSYTGGWPQ